jgi:hypothetical protein
LKATDLARRYGFTARYWTKQAASGRIPGAWQPSGPGGAWLFDEGGFLAWREATKREVVTDAPTAIAAYRNLERLLGSEERVIVPGSADDVAGWDTLYNRLGRPEKADGYGFSAIEGADKGFTAWAEQTFHEAGLSKRQAERLSAQYQSYAAEQARQAQEVFEAQAGQEWSEFERRQGQAYERSMTMMKRVLDHDGLSDPERFAIERALGTKRFLEILHKRAHEVAEDTFPNNPQRAHMLMTAEAAKAKIKELTTSREWTTRYLSDDPRVRAPAIEEMQRLQTIAGGGTA